MPTSPIGPRKRHDDGFTLIEVVVTLFILGLMIAIGATGLSIQQSRSLVRQSEIMTGYLELLRERAHLRHQIHRIYWDLDQQEARCVVVAPNGNELPLRDPFIPARWTWASTIQLRDVWTASAGKTQTGQRRTTISTMGHIEPTAIHLTLSSKRQSNVTTILLRSSTSLPEVVYGDIVYPPST